MQTVSATEHTLIDTNHCPCADVHSRISIEHHDWLLTIESRGAAGVLELFLWADAQAGSMAEDFDDQLGWSDLPDFIARHNWRDPYVMFELAHFVVEHTKRRVKNGEF